MLDGTRGVCRKTLSSAVGSNKDGSSMTRPFLFKILASLGNNDKIKVEP